MASPPPSLYAEAIDWTITRLPELARRAQLQLSLARKWIARLDQLDPAELAAAVRRSDPERLDLAFVEEALAASSSAADLRPERSETWAQLVLYALDLSGDRDASSRALALALRGNARRQLRDFDGAYEHFGEARRTLLHAALVEPSVLAQLDVFEARLLLVLDLSDQAEPLLRRAVDQWHLWGDTSNMARTLVLLAALQLRGYRLDEAFLVARGALRTAPDPLDPEIRIAVENLIAEAAIAHRELDSAQALLASEVPLLADHPLSANRTGLRGRLAMVAGDPAAESLLTDAREAFARLGANHEVALLWVDLAVFYLDQGRRADFGPAIFQADEAFSSASAQTPADSALSVLCRRYQHDCATNPARSFEALLPPPRSPSST